jgi:Multicopper oxidase
MLSQSQFRIVFAGPQSAAYQTGTVLPVTNEGWMVYRMKAAVAGAFLLHCHLAPHLIMGMATVLLVGIEDLPSLPQNFTQEYACVFTLHIMCEVRRANGDV